MEHPKYWETFTRCKKCWKRDPLTVAAGPGNVEIASTKEEKQSKRQGYHVGCHSAKIRKRESTGVNLWELK